MANEITPINRTHFLLDVYTDIVNAHGVKSMQGQDFRDRHAEDTEFLRLAKAVDIMKTAFGTGGAEQSGR